MIKAYYNEIDRNAAAWLRQLIKDGLITDGEVDERSIIDVEASDLVGFDRVHFFAGTGAWDYCLNQSRWGDRQVWTASLPCQPFSIAGKGLGKSDERHLLPHFLELVRQCKPDTIFGEQVKDAIRHGWLDDLCAEMESENYAVGHIVFGAHSIGAAHIRNRLYWVANSSGKRLEEQPGIRRIHVETSGNEQGQNAIRNSRMGDPQHKQYEGSLSGFREKSCEDSEWSPGEFAGSSAVSGVGKPDNNRCDQGNKTTEAIRYRNTVNSAGGFDWLYCRDNKYRPVESGIAQVVDGASEGVVYSGDPCQEINADYSTEAHAMRLKGYGNAIVAGCAIEFISAFMDEIA